MNEDEFLATHNLRRYKIAGDGNCLFRALAHQMTIDDSNHIQIRSTICDYMEKNRDEFSSFFAPSSEYSIQNFNEYIYSMRKTSTYGDHLCLVAFTRIYKLDVRIYRRNLACTFIQNEKKPNHKEISIYYNNMHYDSLVRL
jgi:hypothetical protein